MSSRVKLFGVSLLGFWLVACGVASGASMFRAPASWYNVSRPLTWNDVEGRVVLLDFFTPGCINCVHMVPVEDKLAERFGTRLVIIGVDSPKFTNSGTVSGLKDFITVHHIRHPIVLDKGHRIWKEWDAVAWPTFVLIGPEGEQIGHFIGEQTVEELAGPIKAALADAPPADSLKPLPIEPLAMSGAGLDSPGGIAVSGKRVAISDTANNRIILATRTGEVTAIIGNACAGGQDGSYAEAEFSRPHGLSFHNGKLYVADTRGQKIRVVSLDKQKVSTLAGTGARGFVRYGLLYPADQAVLNSPWDVQWVGGNLYISMAGDHDIWLYHPGSQRLGPWAGSGREGLEDGAFPQAEFAQPSGLTAHGGVLYSADPESSAIRALDLSQHQVETLIGHGLFKFGMRDGPARRAQLQHPEGVLWLDGSLYIADTFNDAVRRLDLDTDRVTTVAKGLAHPQAIAALDDTTLLVAESGGNRIDIVQTDTGKVSKWTLEGLEPASCPVGKT